MSDLTQLWQMPLPPPTHNFAYVLGKTFYLLPLLGFIVHRWKKDYITRGGKWISTYTCKANAKSPSEHEFPSRRYLIKSNGPALSYKWECCGNTAFVWLLRHIRGFHTNPLSFVPSLLSPDLRLHYKAEQSWIAETEITLPDLSTDKR